MNPYQDLTSYLKIVYQNLGTLHHNLVGKSFFVIHPLLGEWYNEIGEMTDDLIERGIPLGFAEPSIKDAVLAYTNDLLGVENRECEDTIILAKDNFINIVEKMSIPTASDNKYHLLFLSIIFKKAKISQIVIIVIMIPNII